MPTNRRLVTALSAACLAAIGCQSAAQAPPAEGLTLDEATITRVAGKIVQNGLGLDFDSREVGDDVSVVLRTLDGRVLFRVVGDADHTDISYMDDRLQMTYHHPERMITAAMERPVAQPTEDPRPPIEADPTCKFAADCKSLSCDNGYTCDWVCTGAVGADCSGNCSAQNCKNKDGGCELKYLDAGTAKKPGELEDTEQALAYAEFLNTPESKLIPYLSMELGDRGIIGSAYPPSFAIHKLGMRLADELSIDVGPSRARRAPHASRLDSTEPAHPELAIGGDGCKDPTRPKCKNAGGKDLCSDPDKNTACGMCGPGLQCWVWVCGDCCGHEGCETHDTHCRNCDASHIWNCVMCACFDFGVPKFKCGNCTGPGGKCVCTLPPKPKKKRFGRRGTATALTGGDAGIVTPDAGGVCGECTPGVDTSCLECSSECPSSCDPATDPSCVEVDSCP